MLSINLKRIMEEKGYKTNSLARKAGMSAGYLSDLMNGIKTNPSAKTLEKLAQALEVTKDELLIENPENFNTGLEDLEEESRILFSRIKKLSKKDKAKLSKMLDIFEEESN